MSSRSCTANLIDTLVTLDPNLSDEALVVLDNMHEELFRASCAISLPLTDAEFEACEAINSQRVFDM